MAKRTPEAGWKRPAPPRPAHTRLSPARKAAAKKAARKAGRPYPNWVDNARAARQQAKAARGRST